jgi:hypothetical protein
VRGWEDAWRCRTTSGRLANDDRAIFSPRWLSPHPSSRPVDSPQPPQPRFRRATRPVSRRDHHRVRSASSIDSSSDASCRCSATHTRDARIFVPLPFGSHSRCSRYASLFENATPGLKRYREPRLDTNISIDYSKDCRRIPSLIDLHECATKTDQPVTTAQKGLHQR